MKSTTLGNFVLFADDTNVFIVGKTAKEAYDRANIVIEDIYNYMLSNQLHINMNKCTYMHFRPRYNNEERQTCARASVYNSEPVLKLRGHKLKKVDKVKFLGVIIDDKINWDAHIDLLETKLKSSIIMIKRIKRYIPQSEYTKIYNALFMSHLTYCISCWGGVSSYKLQKVFSIQKRCIRLLFGKQFSFDHAEFYETCARTRTYEENMAPKNFSLEHTKPLFNENKILCLNNLYTYHTFMELYKVIKHHSPISIYDLLTVGPRKSEKFTLILPHINLEKTKQNFVFKSTLIWNKFINIVLNRWLPQSNGGLVIPGDEKHSDMSTSICIVKNKLKLHLLLIQQMGVEKYWTFENLMKL